MPYTAEQKRAAYQARKEELKAKARERYEDNAEAIKKARMDRYYENAEKERLEARERYHADVERSRERKKKASYMKTGVGKFADDLKAYACRIVVGDGFYSLTDITRWIEFQFTLKEGLNWENYGADWKLGHLFDPVDVIEDETAIISALLHPLNFIVARPLEKKIIKVLPLNDRKVMLMTSMIKFRKFLEAERILGAKTHYDDIWVTSRNPNL